MYAPDPEPTAPPAPGERADAARPHLSRAHAVARRLLGCDHLADDAVQEALLALVQQPEEPADLRGWLVRAVVHRCRHLRRSAVRRQKHEHCAAGTAGCALHDGCDNPLHVAVAHELSQRVVRAIDTLPAEQRRALALFEDQGLDYAGIAARLAVPIGTLRSRLARARATVRAALGRTLHDV